MVFAGVDVSMGSPANWPGFHRLSACATCCTSSLTFAAWDTGSTGTNWTGNQRTGENDEGQEE